MTLAAPLSLRAEAVTQGPPSSRTVGAHGWQPLRSLPNWPLYLLYAGFPVLWVLGFGSFAQQIVAIPMLTCLLTRGSIRIPRGFSLWLLFIFWMLCSSLEIHGGGRLLGFSYRASLYLGATVVFLYVYNTSAATLPIARLAGMMCFFLGFIVLGGYVGLADPYGAFSTPLQHLAPAALAANDTVGQLLHPVFAQTAGAARLHVRPRPAAPFAFTNDWGVNYALLVPFAIVRFTTAKAARTRVVVAVLLVLSLVPALFTLNRGMLLGLSVGFVYAAIRFAGRGHVKGLLAIVIVAALGFGVSSALHFQSLLHARTSQSNSITDRTSSYSADLAAVKKSPLLGYGAPSASTVSVTAPALGTQGQLWAALYASGFPGALFFVGSLCVFAWRTRRPATAPLMWMHVIPIMALVMIPVYRLSGTELTIVMAAVAIALRDVLPSRSLVRHRAPGYGQAVAGLPATAS
jgi:polysaccharide biosynthesis protein PslJ